MKRSNLIQLGLISVIRVIRVFSLGLRHKKNTPHTRGVSKMNY